MWHVWNDDGLGQNTSSGDARERERIARITGAALSTVTPGGVYVPMPFNLPNGAVAIGRRARTGAGGRLDPWTEVVVLLNPDGSPGPAYSWPTSTSGDYFISPGNAPGFPVRDFYCGFHPGICDHLTRAMNRQGPNPCWGKPSGTCDPNQYAQGGGSVSAEVARQLQQPGLTRESAVAAAFQAAEGGTIERTIPAEATGKGTPSAQPKAQPKPASSSGIPATINVLGMQISPLVLGAALLGGYLLLRR